MVRRVFATLLSLPFSSAFSIPKRPIRPFSAVESKLTMSSSQQYSLPDQPARFAQAKEENNRRYLDIASVYDPSYLKGLRVAVTGANRGVGLALATELTEVGAQLIALVRSTSPELDALNPAEVIKGIDVTDDAACAKLHEKITGGPIDIVSGALLSGLIPPTDAPLVSNLPTTTWRS